MYIHKVQYYETDKMGITHHSNYIRWMEEARVDMLEKIDFGYVSYVFVVFYQLYSCQQEDLQFKDRVEFQQWALLLAQWLD